MKTQDSRQKVITTDRVADPHKTALYASSVLAADKGIPSEIVETEGGFDVVTDNGRFRFLHLLPGYVKES